MTEFPGYQPWHIAGDPWYTHEELDALVETANRRLDQRRKDHDEAQRRGRSGGRPTKRAGRRARRRR